MAPSSSTSLTNQLGAATEEETTEARPADADAEGCGIDDGNSAIQSSQQQQHTAAKVAPQQQQQQHHAQVELTAVVPEYNTSSPAGHEGHSRSSSWLLQQQQQQKEQAGVDTRPDDSAAAATAGDIHTPAPAAVSPAAVAAPPATGDAVAAAEASLPTFAQRRLQLQAQLQEASAGGSSSDCFLAQLAPAGSPVNGADISSQGIAVTQQEAAAGAAAAAPHSAEAEVKVPAGNTTVLYQQPAAHTAAASTGQPRTSSHGAQEQAPAAAADADAGVGSSVPLPLLLEAVSSGKTSGAPASNEVITEAAAGPGAADATAAAAAAVAADPVRQFVFTVDVPSFQAGRRLPIALASTYVQAFLPQELLGESRMANCTCWQATSNKVDHWVGLMQFGTSCCLLC